METSKKKEARMNIGYVFDEGFAECATVSILSLFKNNRDADICLWIFDDGIQESTLKMLKEMCDEYNNHYEIVSVNKYYSFFEEKGLIPWRGRYSTYVKMLISQMLPRNIERLIMLDADTIIVGNIGELDCLFLDGKPCAMALEGISGKFHRYSDVGRYELYNGGLIIYNMPVWRQMGVEERILEYWETRRNHLLLGEEETISAVLKGHIKTLPCKFNYVTQFFLYTDKKYYHRFRWDELGKSFYTLDEIRESSKDIRIYHCIDTLTGRPWDADNIHPYTQLYDQYRRETVWNDKPKVMPNRSRWHSVLYGIRRILPLRMSLYFNYLTVNYSYGIAAKRFYNGG